MYLHVKCLICILVFNAPWQRFEQALHLHVILLNWCTSQIEDDDDDDDDDGGGGGGGGGGGDGGGGGGGGGGDPGGDDDDDDSVLPPFDPKALENDSSCNSGCTNNIAKNC